MSNRDVHASGHSAVHSVGHGETSRVHACLCIGVNRIRLGRGGVVAERPKVGKRLTLGVARSRTREGDLERRSSGRRIARRDRDRSLVRLHVPNPSDLAHTELAAVVGVPEVDVVERTVRSLGEVDDVTVRSVCGTVGRLEVHRAGHVAAGVEGQALDPVLSRSRRRRSCPGSCWDIGFPGTRIRL